MRLYTVSAVIGYEKRMLRGRMEELPITEGLISDRENCNKFALEHENVSEIRRFKRGSKTHGKARSGKNMAMKKERRKKKR